MKKKILIFIVCVMIMNICLSPIALASSNNSDLGSIDVNVDSNGKITVGPSGTATHASGATRSSIIKIISNYKEIAAVVLGICVITSIIMLLVAILRLGTSGDNQQARANSWKAIIVSAVALSLFGGSGAAIGIFWNFLK